MLLDRVRNRIYLASHQRIFSLFGYLNPSTEHCLAESYFNIWQSILQQNKSDQRLATVAAIITTILHKTGFVHMQS
jgi:hypothetical protein